MLFKDARVKVTRELSVVSVQLTLQASLFPTGGVEGDGHLEDLSPIPTPEIDEIEVLKARILELEPLEELMIRAQELGQSEMLARLELSEKMVELEAQFEAAGESEVAAAAAEKNKLEFEIKLKLSSRDATELELKEKILNLEKKLERAQRDVSNMNDTVYTRGVMHDEEQSELEKRLQHMVSAMQKAGVRLTSDIEKRMQHQKWLGWLRVWLVNSQTPQKQEGKTHMVAKDITLAERQYGRHYLCNAINDKDNKPLPGACQYCISIGVKARAALNTPAFCEDCTFFLKGNGKTRVYLHGACHRLWHEQEAKP